VANVLNTFAALGFGFVHHTANQLINSLLNLFLSMVQSFSNTFSELLHFFIRLNSLRLKLLCQLTQWVKQGMN